MFAFSTQGAVDSLRAITPILAFRLLPFAGYVAISPGRPWLARGFTIAAYGGLSMVAVRQGATPLVWLVLAYVYCAAAGWAAYELVPHVRSRSAWFAILTALFWGLPLAIVRPMPATFLLVGWDAILSAYSYGIDTRKETGRSLRAFLFFVLVNPVLVYRNRGRFTTPRLDVRGMLRMLLGALAVLLSIRVFDPLHARALALNGMAKLHAAELFSAGATRLAGEYAVQSGVASIQIGVMRQLGYVLPERFRFPLLARSPAEFWRRWNTYVGDWARLYVFLPLTRYLRRRSPRGARSARLEYAISVVVTFAVVGVLHDAFVVAESGSFQVPATAWFVASGIVVVTWEACAGWLRRRDSSRAGPALERTLFAIAATCAAAELWW